MNRRTFITSLLATTAAIPITRLVPPSTPSKALVPFFGVDLARAGSDRTVYTAVYMSDEAPMQFTGYRLFVPAPNWLDETYDIVEAE